MTKADKILVAIPSVLLGFLVFAVCHVVWAFSVQNDFWGDIEVVTEGEFYEEYDCFGDSVGTYIGDQKAPFAFYKVPQGGISIDGNLYYPSGLLIKGRHYRVYQKTFGWFNNSSHFIDCIEEK